MNKIRLTGRGPVLALDYTMLLYDSDYAKDNTERKPIHSLCKIHPCP